MKYMLAIFLLTLSSTVAIANPCVQTLSYSWSGPDDGLPFGHRWLEPGDSKYLQYDYIDDGIRCCFSASSYGGDIVFYFLLVSNLEAGDFIRVEYDAREAGAYQYGTGYWGTSEIPYNDYIDLAFSFRLTNASCDNSSQFRVPTGKDSLLIGFRVEYVAQPITCGVLQDIHLILPGSASVLSTDGTVSVESSLSFGSVKSMYR